MGRHCKCSGIFHQCHFTNKVFWSCLLRVKIVNESLLCKIQLCIYNKCSFLAVHKKQRKSSDNWWTPSIVAWLQQKIKVSFCVFAEAENKENVTQMWKVIYSSLWKWKHSRFCSSKRWLWLYRSHTLSILLDRWIVLHSLLHITHCESYFERRLLSHLLVFWEVLMEGKVNCCE